MRVSAPPATLHVRRKEFFGRLREAIALKDQRARKQGKRFTRAELARRLDVGAGSVSEWFTQGHLPSGEAMLQLPTILACDGHWLLTGEGTPNQRSMPAAAARTLGARLALGEVEASVNEASTQLQDALRGLFVKWGQGSAKNGR